MPRVRKTSLGSHLKPSYFKEFKSDHEHDLQDHILKLSQHHLALIDEIVTKVNQGKRLDSNFYPDIDIDHFKSLAKQLHGHTHSVTALAKKHREIKGAGWGNLLNFGTKAGKAGLKGAQKAAKLAWAGAKFAGKTGAKYAQKSAQFLIANPMAAMAIGQTVGGLAQSMLVGDEPQQQQQQPQQRRKPKTSQTAALDELLDTTDDEKEPIVRQARQKGSGLSRSRWVI